MQRRSLLRATGAAVFLAATPLVRAQGSQQKFKFNLGWKFEASAAGCLLAQQRGYYKDAGLDVTVDTGNGSTAAIGLVASGAYDAASADLASMIEFDVNNPDAHLKAVAIQYDLNLNSMIVRKNGPIQKPADLAGKTLLGQPFNASRKLFPAFAKAQGFDPSGVKWENVAPDIGDTRFAKGDFDGAAYFFFTGLLNLRARGVPEDQLKVFKYADYGLKSYGNGIVTTQKVLDASPDAMRAFVRATTRGWVEVIADPKAGAAAIKAREPLASEALELDRLKLMIDGTMLTAAVRQQGWGVASAERMQATIDETALAFALKSKPAVDAIWTDRFLPPLAERKLKV